MVTFVFPLIYAVFFGVIFANVSGGITTLNVVIVDEDRTEQSAAFVERITRASELSATLGDREAALDGIRHSRYVASVIIPAGFGASLTGAEGGAHAELELTTDPTRRLEAGMLEGLLIKYAVPDGPSAAAVPTIKVETMHEAARSSTDPGPSGAYAVAFPQGIVWGVLGCTATFCVSMVMERRRGTLFRLRAAPITRAAILAGKATACFLMTILMGTALFAIAVGLFGVQPHSYVGLTAALLSIAVGFVGIMMLLSVLGRTEQAASGISWTILLAMAMSGGAMVPYFFMPAWLQGIADFSPVRWAILAMDGAIWRQLSPSEMVQPCGLLVAVGLVSLTAGVWCFRWTD